MDNRAVVDRILRNLDIDLEAVPKHKATKKSYTSTSKNDPLNVKIRVRKKDNVNEPSNQGFITNIVSEPEMVLQKVRLVNSDETIMTFDMFMEADEKTSPKSRKMFGSCLGAPEDDGGPYMADSDRVLRTQNSRNAHDTYGDSSLTRRDTTFLGKKCKPGGCLDPPFTEDRYSYMPREHSTNERDSPSKYKADEMNVKQDMEPEKKDIVYIDILKKTSKPSLHKIESPKKMSASYTLDKEKLMLRTGLPSEDNESLRSRPSIKDKSKYPPVDKYKYPLGDQNNTFSTKTPSENNRRRSENKYRQSVNESINSFFSPPKGIKRESSQRDSLNRHSNIPVLNNKPIDYFKTPISVNASAESVPLEQNADPNTNAEIQLKYQSIPEPMIESKPNQENNEQIHIVHSITALSNSEAFTADAIQLDQVVVTAKESISVIPKQASKESLKVLDLSTSLAIAAPMQDESTLSPNLEINEASPVSPSPPQKAVSITSIEKLPSIPSKISKIDDYENPEELLGATITTTDTKNEELEASDTVIIHNEQEQLIDVNKSNSYVVGKDSPIGDYNRNTKQDGDTDVDDKDAISISVKKESLTINLENIKEEVILSPHLQKLDDDNASLPSEYDKIQEMLRTTETPPALEEKYFTTQAHDVKDETNIIASTKSLDTSLNNNKLYQNLNPKVEAQDFRNLKQIIKSDSDINSPTNKLLISEIISPDDNEASTLSTDLKRALNLSPNTISMVNKSPIKVQPLIPVHTKWNKPSLRGHPKLAVMDEIVPMTGKFNSNAGTISLDLAFHSYLNSQNERIFSTLDTKYEVQRYPNDAILHINSQITLSPKKYYHRFVIPVDSNHNMHIELKKSNDETIFEDDAVETKTEPVPKTQHTQPTVDIQKTNVVKKDSSQKLIKTDENQQVCSALTNIYEKELIPLQSLIKNLKQEIDELATQQIAYKKKVVCLQKTKLPHIMHSNKPCRAHE